MEMEVLCVPDDVLEEANAARYQMLPEKNWKNLRVNENQ
jgi:hypothetical protein